MMRDMLKISYMAAMGEGLDKYRDKIGTVICGTACTVV